MNIEHTVSNFHVLSCVLHRSKCNIKSSLNELLYSKIDIHYDESRSTSIEKEGSIPPA